MAIQKLFSVTAKNQLQLVALLMKREATTGFAVIPYTQGVTEPIKKIRILSRKNNEPTPFILFLALIVTDQTSVWYTFERTSKSGFILQKGKFSFIGIHMTN